MGRARVRHAAVGAACVLGLLALSACGGDDGGDSSLTEFTGSSTTAPTTTTAAPSTSAPTSAAPPEGVEVTVDYADGLTGQAKAAAEAYGDYWTFIGATLTKPPMDVAAAGKVVTGEALDNLASLANQRAADKRTSRGTAKVVVKSVTVSGSSASLCAQVADLTVGYQGDKVVNTPDGQVENYQAQLTLSGPLWRTSKQTEVKSC